MDKILDNLFYNEKLGVGNKTTFITSGMCNGRIGTY